MNEKTGEKSFWCLAMFVAALYFVARIFQKRAQIQTIFKRTNKTHKCDMFGGLQEFRFVSLRYEIAFYVSSAVCVIALCRRDS